jgi:hypothetical protein
LATMAVSRVCSEITWFMGLANLPSRGQERG